MFWNSSWQELRVERSGWRANRVIKEDAWTAERVRAWHDAQDMVAQAVPLYHTRPGYVVLMFPDASDFHGGSFFTQVPEEEFRSGVALENIVSGKVHTAHVARLRLYADADLNITAEVKDVFQHSYAQGECLSLIHI